MRWFRSQRRPWVLVALFALALQLVLSFGHVHGVAAAHASQVTAIADSGERAAAPQPDTGDPGDNDYCAICAVLTLLTGAQAASAPVFVPPAAIIANNIVFADQAPLLGARHAAFRSRAPPHA